MRSDRLLCVLFAPMIDVLRVRLGIVGVIARRAVLSCAVLQLIVTALFLNSAVAELKIPPISARVTDYSQALPQGVRASLEARLAEFERVKGAQLAVFILPTTEGEPIEQFAVRVAESWKLGRDRINDAALLVVATGDKRVRIEVGYGLEGALSDIVCKRIIEEVILPQFRRGDLAGGVEAGISAMLRVVDGEPLPPPQQGQQVDQLSNLELLILLIVFGFILYSIYFNLRYGSSIPRGYSRRGRYRRSPSDEWGGGFGGGGFSGGGFGGFRGGGGRFSGGGASGSW